MLENIIGNTGWAVKIFLLLIMLVTFLLISHIGLIVIWKRKNQGRIKNVRKAVFLTLFITFLISFAPMEYYLIYRYIIYPTETYFSVNNVKVTDFKEEPLQSKDSYRGLKINVKLKIHEPGTYYIENPQLVIMDKGQKAVFQALPEGIYKKITVIEEDEVHSIDVFMYPVKEWFFQSQAEGKLASYMSPLEFQFTIFNEEKDYMMGFKASDWYGSGPTPQMTFNNTMKTRPYKLAEFDY